MCRVAFDGWCGLAAGTKIMPHHASESAMGGSGRAAKSLTERKLSGGVRSTVSIQCHAISSGRMRGPVPYW